MGSASKKKVPSTKKFVKPSFVYLIEKKRDGGEFSEDEIRFIVDSIFDGEMPQHQVSALLMAIYFKGLSAQETSTYAEELMLSGDVVEFDRIHKPKIDRYSTGGVGDKTAFILPALSAACGVIMPSMICDEENFIIGSLDKLSVIPGFKGNSSLKDFEHHVSKAGCALAIQPDNVAPVAKQIYELRQQTATVQCLPLITGSVLSKKLAAGTDGLIFDIKWGNGALIKDLEQAKQLARAIIRVAKNMNRKCIAMVTDMNEPLGDCVGTAFEIKEAIALLKGDGPADLQDLLLKMGMEVVRLAGVAGSTLSAKQMVLKHLKNGSALVKFREMIAIQGGDVSYIDNPDKFGVAKHNRKLSAPKRGYVHTINAGMVARGVQILAQRKDGTFDPTVGVTDLRKIGTQIKQGEPLMMIHYNDESKLESALEYLRNAYRLAPKRPSESPLIVERLA